MLPALLLAVALPLTIDVTWGDRRTAGSDDLRAGIEREIATAIDAEACFASVGLSGPEPGPLRLEVLLEEYHEEKSFDDSLAEYVTPGEPSKQLRLQALFTVTVRWLLWAGEGDVPFREKRFKILREKRPVVIGEDAAITARDEAIVAIGRETARTVCKAAGPKLEAAAGAR